MTKPLESVIETYLKDQIRALDGLSYKFTSTVIGVPDQIIIYQGHTYLVEVKRPGETLRPSQVHVHRQITQRGVGVYVVDSIASMNEFIRDVLNTEPSDLKTKASTETTVVSFSDIIADKQEE